MSAPISSGGNEEAVPCVVISKLQAQKIRKYLQEDGLWDSRYGLKKMDNEMVAVPITVVAYRMLTCGHTLLTIGRQIPHSLPEDIDYTVKMVNLLPSKKASIKSPHKQLKEALEELLVSCEELKTHNYKVDTSWQEDLPKHWEKHGDMVVLPEDCFKIEIWNHFGSELWENISRILGARRLAKKSVISQNGFRTPQVKLLHGDNGCVIHIDNQIKYSYDITKCMFSAGNITEKLRVASFHCEGETVVDLYAGIGYFTLPYLVHAKARLVYSCEWNPDAAEALRRNLQLNGVADRCIVYEGDNRQVCPKGVADRVNLGLIPSSEEGWPVACVALKPDIGGVLHIHGNVETKPHNSGRTHSSQDNVEKEYGLNGDASIAIQCRSCNASKTCINSIVKGGTDSDNLQEHINEVGSMEDTYHLNAQHCDESSKGNSMMTDTNTPFHTKASVPIASDCHTLGKNNTEGNEKLHCSCQSKNQLDSLDTNVTFNKMLKYEWKAWALSVASQIRDLLCSTHGSPWRTEILHLEHVKSYAPHVDHMVLDLLCKPT